MRPPATVPWALASLSLAMLLSSLATSIANIALPTLALAFDSSFQAIQWVVLAYLLAVTTLVVSAGRLGDLVGRRKLMLAGIAVFTAASIACGAAQDLWSLIAARAAQGFGAAVMMALTLAFVGDAVPKERAGRAMGWLGTVSAIGTALGPPLGGALIATSGWRAIFLVNVPLGLLAFGIAYRHLPTRDVDGDRQSFDYGGSLLLAFALACYALSMTLGRGGFGPTNVMLLLTALSGAGFFLMFEARTRHPLLRLALFRDPVVGSGFAQSGLAATVAMTTLVVGPFHLAGALHLSAAAIGLVMSAGPLVAALAGVPAGRAVDRFGALRMSVVGLAVMAGGCIALSLVPASCGIPGYIAPLVAVTAGFATFQAANNTAVLKGVEASQRGVVAGLLGLARNLGLITGASVMGTVFSTAVGRNIGAASAGTIAAGTHATFMVAAALVVLALMVAWRAAPSTVAGAPAR
ncbi:MAG: MFS transporter [Steroidobacteraceae bacterium]